LDRPQRTQRAQRKEGKKERRKEEKKKKKKKKEWSQGEACYLTAIDPFCPLFFAPFAFFAVMAF